MKVLSCCKINLMQWHINPKYAMVVAYLAFYMWTLTHGFVQFSRDMGYPVRPWLFPVFPSSVNLFVPVYLSYPVLISDAPFRNSHQQFVLLRLGKRNWILGQLLYLLVLSLVFTILMWLLTWMFLLPRLEWGLDWGKIIITSAYEHLADPYGVMTIMCESIENVKPLAATAWVFFMMVSVNFLLGEITLLCNLWSKKGLGAVLTVLLILMPFIIWVLAASPYAITKLSWLSPVSWLDRTMLLHSNQNKPSFLYAAIMTSVLNLLLATVSVGTIHKCNLDTEE